jgi:hypothetical protein
VAAVWLRRCRVVSADCKLLARGSREPARHSACEVRSRFLRRQSTDEATAARAFRAHAQQHFAKIEFFTGRQAGARGIDM